MHDQIDDYGKSLERRVIRCRMYACFAGSRLFCLWQNGGVLKPVQFRRSKVVGRSERGPWLCERMAMLVSILGLWANKNTFINRKKAETGK